MLSRPLKICHVGVSVGRGLRGRNQIRSLFAPCDQFVHRHLGPNEADQKEMLATLGYSSLEEFVKATIPENILFESPLMVGPPQSESEALMSLKKIMSKNVVNKSFIGMGYHDTQTPGVILRNVLQNPGWYTSYTPYQPEISQGRLESLLNFQTMVSDLTGMEMCGASLLDEGTAAAEAMNMCNNLVRRRNKFFVADDCHPQTIGVVKTRGEAMGLDVVVGSIDNVDFSNEDFSGVLVSYPNTHGHVNDLSALAKTAHAFKTLVVAVVDLMSLTLLKAPGEWGADIAVGSAQRFGVPMGFGGPHAGFLSTKKQLSRKMPGRLVGVSVDNLGKPALRLAMQTREQHIRRGKATSNICTAQALLANMASLYAVYHGPQGLRAIAGRIHGIASVMKDALRAEGYAVSEEAFFDAFTVSGVPADKIIHAAAKAGHNLRKVNETVIGISVGETATRGDIVSILNSFGCSNTDLERIVSSKDHTQVDPAFSRTSDILTHPIFNTHHSETQMLRYLKSLENKDIALNHSMIPLGSCTMKLNATSEMVPVTWPEVCDIHPFVPADQARGYLEMIQSLNTDLCHITGYAGFSVQPNSGAQGEYAGLLCIRDYHKANGDHHRNICLIPKSAHGTNPASAVMASMKVVVVKNDNRGCVDLEDVRKKLKRHGKNLAAIMVTYPSTYGVFEEEIVTLCNLIHSHGGQVYMDGANMNAQVGLTSPGEIGADVCHLNLHKTFCIPHGGGGPGVGPIGVKEHLVPYLPGHVVVPTGGEGLKGAKIVQKTTGAVSAAPYSSAAILPISWMYIKMLGDSGLRKATQVALLNANYMSKRLRKSYKVLFSESNCAHEFIIDCRNLKSSCGVTEKDIAKRLADFGFHAPTMSWPEPGTLMVEPTESEDKGELDRFCDALLIIRKEIHDVESGKVALPDSPLTGAPHTAEVVLSAEWGKPYSRATAAFPAPWVAANKFWPTVGRLDDVFGDRNLVCSCPSVEEYEDN